MCGTSITLILKETMAFKIPCISLNKSINFNRNETNSKMKNSTHSFRKTNFPRIAYL